MPQVAEEVQKKGFVLKSGKLPVSQRISTFMQDLEKEILAWAKKREDLKLAKGHNNGNFVFSVCCSSRKHLTDFQVKDINEFVTYLQNKHRNLTVEKLRNDKVFVTLKFSRQDA